MKNTMNDQEHHPHQRGARPQGKIRIHVLLAMLAVLGAAALSVLLYRQSPVAARFFQIGLALAILAFILVFVIRSVRKGDIRRRLLVSFVLAVLLPLLVIGAIATISTTRILEKSVFVQLESTATLKESELNRWAASLHSYLENIFLPGDRSGLASLLHEEQNPLEQPKNNAVALQIRVVEATRSSQLFSEIFVLNPSGRVVLSSDPRRSGQDYAHEPLFTHAWLGPTLAPSTASFGEDGLHTFAALPLAGPNGQFIGVLAGRVRMDALHDILFGEKLLGETGEIYLVAGSRNLVTPTRWKEPPALIHSAGTDQAVGLQQAGYSVYAGPGGENVFGVYRWLPQLNMALLVEQSYAEALGPVYTATLINAGAALFAIAIAIAAALLMTRTITRPLQDLSRVAAQIALGDLHLRARVERQDEVGSLATAFNSMADQLQDEISGLEQRVQERTHDLEHRRWQIQTAAEVARDIAAAPDLNSLLDQAVEMICSRFGFYHAGIFLMDARGEYALLRAAAGEAGQMMLAQGHRLKAGETGLVGFVAAHGQPRIAQDVGADQLHYKNPHLPETRSELALPLRQSRRVTGVLDVQSSEPNAFTEEDISILQTMADQLAVAIEKTHLIREMNETMQELEHAYSRYTEAAWTELVRKQQQLNFRYSLVEVLPVQEPHPEAVQALQSGGQVVLSAGPSRPPDLPEGQSALAVPIRLRSQVIGVLNLRFHSPEVPAETAAAVEEIAARLALVLENARLFQEAQERAGRERLVSEITDKMQRANDLDRLVALTLQELQGALGATYAVVQFEEPGSEPAEVS